MLPNIVIFFSLSCFSFKFLNWEEIPLHWCSTKLSKDKTVSPTFCSGARAVSYTGDGFVQSLFLKHRL